MTCKKKLSLLNQKSEVQENFVTFPRVQIARIFNFAESIWIRQELLIPFPFMPVMPSHKSFNCDAKPYMKHQSTIASLPHKQFLTWHIQAKCPTESILVPTPVYTHCIWTSQANKIANTIKLHQILGKTQISKRLQNQLLGCLTSSKDCNWSLSFSPGTVFRPSPGRSGSLVSDLRQWRARHWLDKLRTSCWPTYTCRSWWHHHQIWPRHHSYRCHQRSEPWQLEPTEMLSNP